VCKKCDGGRFVDYGLIKVSAMAVVERAVVEHLDSEHGERVSQNFP
jgi:hypothetical protein